MPFPNLDNRAAFKNYVRFFKNKFTSAIQDVSLSDIENILSYKASGLGNPAIKFIIFDNYDNINVTSLRNNRNYVYLPGLPNDSITLTIDSTPYDFTFIGEDGGIRYNGITYGLNQTIGLPNASLVVKGLGGALLLLGPAPSYTVGLSTTIVNEGDSVNVTINTTEVGAGTTLYYSTSGTVSAADFSNNSLTGSFNIVGAGAATGIATITRTITSDFETEGNETFQFVLRTGSISGTIVGIGSTVTVINTIPTFSITQSATSVNEGGSVTFTVTTNNVPNGTYYWTALQVSGVISSADFSDGDLYSAFNITNGTGTIVRGIASDRSTETLLESFKIEIRRNSSTGTIVATSDTVTINDTSVNVGQDANGLTFGPVQVNRDGGNAAYASDWYTICGLDNVPEGSSIALFIDTSGSMTLATVQASYNLLVSKLAAKNISITAVYNGNEDWITPFLVDLP